MRKKSESTEILIVGAGPVGLLSAITLASAGAEVIIVDQAPGPCAHSYGLALHRPVLRELQKVGMLEDIMSFAYPLERLGICLHREPLRTIRFADVLSDDGVPVLVTLSQADFEKLLLEKLRYLGVEMRWAQRATQVTQEADGVRVSMQALEEHLTGYAVAHFESMVAEDWEVKAERVLACDGWRSPMRRGLGVRWQVFGQPTDFAFFEFDTWTDQHYELTLALADERAHVSWPLNPHCARWCFELPLHPPSLSGREKEREYIFVGGFPYASPEREVFDQLLDRAAPGLGSPPEHLRWRVVVPFARALADSFAQGRVLLLGDAAHTLMPGGVQNMNASLIEAAEMARDLIAVRSGEVTAERLHGHAARLHSAWRERLQASEPITLAAGADQALAPWVSQIFENLPASGEDLLDLAEAVGLVIPDSLAHAVVPALPT